MLDYQLDLKIVTKRVLYENGKEIQVVPLLYKGEEYPQLFLDSDGHVYTGRARDLNYRSEVWIKRCTYNYHAGYPCVIWLNHGTGIRHRLRVHIAVASTFIPINKLNYVKGVPNAIVKLSKSDEETLKFLYDTLQVNHIDHDRSNYSIQNLEWITGRGNIDAYRKHAGYME